MRARSDRPFRGSKAVAAGEVKWSTLRGPHYVHLLPDIYVDHDVEVDFRVRALATELWGGPDAAVAGWAACVLLGADVVPRAVEQAGLVDLVVGPERRRPPQGVVVHRDALWVSDVLECEEATVTTPLRTTLDLARWVDLTDAVVAADRLGRLGEFDGAALVARVAEQRQVRGAVPGARAAVLQVARLMDRRAESPMETRTRLVFVHGGLPAPVPQYVVRDEGGQPLARVDLAWPDQRVAVEYDGWYHRDPAQHALDLDRDALLADLGWQVVHVTGRQVYRTPDRLVARVGALVGVTPKWS